MLQSQTEPKTRLMKLNTVKELIPRDKLQERKAQQARNSFMEVNNLEGLDISNLRKLYSNIVSIDGASIF